MSARYLQELYISNPCGFNTDVEAERYWYNYKRDGKFKYIEKDGSIYEGDWENIPVEGVISIEIIYDSAQITEDSNEDSGSVPGFSAIITLISILGAIVVSRKDE